MSWLFERRTIPSEHNGLIKCERRFGVWEVYTGGNGQTCALLNDLWHNTLNKRLPKSFKAKRILMLGLATGGTIPIYRKRFPDAHIIALERDPEMIRLMDEFMRFSAKDRPEVVLGDVRDTLPKQTGTFDLVVVDIYEGMKVSPAAEHAILWQHIARLLNRDGSILFNVFEQPNLFAHIPLPLVVDKTWKYRTNWMGILRKASAGVLGAPLPEGYRRHNATPEFLQREFTHRPGFTLIRSGEAYGVRNTAGWFDIEQYYGDVEPRLQADTRSRLVLWHPTSRRDGSAGWLRLPFSIHRRLTGFHDLHEADDYWLTWSSQAQRHRKAWHKSQELRATTPNLDRFLASYHQSGQIPSLVRLFEEHLRHQVVVHAEHMHIFGIETLDGQLVSAIATIDIPESQLSFHVTSFILPSARTTPAGVAILDLWFQAAKAKGLRFLDFDGFWTKGEPENWKGFSLFKAQFGMTYIRYPRPLMRWMKKR